MNAPTAASYLEAPLSAEELRDAEIAKRALKIAAMTRSLIRINHAETIHDISNALGNVLCDDEVIGKLAQAALVGPLTAGEMFVTLLAKCIADDADTEAVKQVERIEAGRDDGAADRAQHDREMAAHD